MSKLGRIYIAKQKRSCLVLLIVVPIVVLLAGAFIFVPLWLVQNNQWSPTVVLWGGTLFLSSILGFGVVFGTFVIRRRTKQLEAIFGAGGLGLQGSYYLFQFRQYHGTINNRNVDVYFYRGPTIDIYLQTPLQTRFTVGDKNQPASLINAPLNQPLREAGDSGWLDLCVDALDQTWMHNFLGRQQARNSIRHLLQSNQDAVLRQINLRPNAFELCFRHTTSVFAYHLSREEVQSWFADLFQIADIAERIPAPTITHQAGALEQLRQSNRDKLNRKTIPIMIGCFALLTIFLIAIALAIVFLESNRTNSLSRQPARHCRIAMKQPHALRPQN